LSGNDGDDVLRGMQGDDSLYGNNGNDVLDGGAENEKSRRWRDGGWKVFCTAANDAMFVMRSER